MRKSVNSHSGKELPIQFPAIYDADESAHRTALNVIFLKLDFNHLVWLRNEV